METAYAWEGQVGPPPEISALFPKAEMIFAIPEYKVPLPGGGADSQNDVFVLLRDDKGLVPVMVEAKRDEPFGPTLTEWLADPSAGKTSRLGAIGAMLGLDVAGLDGSLRYQLFHRTASALVTAGRLHTKRAAMVVQSFSPEHRWFGAFHAFTGLLGAKPARGTLAEVSVPGGVSLGLAWVHSPLRTEEILP